MDALCLHHPTSHPALCGKTVLENKNRKNLLAPTSAMYVEPSYDSAKDRYDCNEMDLLVS
jgi:hypothetical protein